MLKGILDKKGVSVWTSFNRFEIGPMAGFCEHNDETSGFLLHVIS